MGSIYRSIFTNEGVIMQYIEIFQGSDHGKLQIEINKWIQGGRKTNIVDQEISTVKDGYLIWITISIIYTLD